MRSLVSLLVLLLALPQCLAFILSLDEKECLTQHVEAGDSLTGRFTVVDADVGWSHGSHTVGVDFWIESPNNYKVFSVRNREEETFQIRAIHSGDYKFCLETVHQYVPLVVDFTFHIGHLQPAKLEDVAKDEHFDELFQQLWTLESDVWEIMQTQEHFKARDERRKRTLETTSKRILWYNVLEVAVLAAACGVQLFVVRRLFEKKGSKLGA